MPDGQRRAHAPARRRWNAGFLKSAVYRPLGAAVLALIAGGWAPMQQFNVARAVPPTEIAQLIYLQHRPPQEDACRKFHAPNLTSATAEGMSVDHHQADTKTCSELRAISEADPPAAPKATVGTQPPRANGPERPQQRVRQLHATALALYRATSRDAETFTAALLLPEVRHKVEAALQQKLSNEQCRALAQQAQAEAIYWYKYMQGLERAEAGADHR